KRGTSAVPLFACMTAHVTTSLGLAKIRGMSAVAGPRFELGPASSNLPRFLTTFIGREPDLRSLKSLVRASRMVTLIGTGGAGKSRLAVEVATNARNEWPDGIWWIELAAADDVTGKLIATFELPGQGPALRVVSAWLAPQRTLIILDNCEHLVDACALVC